MASTSAEDLILEALRRRPSAQRLEPGPGARYVLYGAGNLARQILAMLRQLGAEVVAFIDQRAVAGGKLEGIPMLHPDDPELRRQTAGADGIIIAVYNHRANLRDIFTLLRARTNAPLFSAPDLARAVPRGKLLLDYWLDLLEEPAATGEIAPRLAHTHGLLADALSRELFLELVALRASGDYEATHTRMHQPDLERQYFPADLPAPICAQRIIDCGAYDGDTLAAALQFAGPVERAACFEPDARNFRKLVARTQTIPPGPEIELFPLAVWLETAVLTFDADREASSSLASTAAAGRASAKVHVQAVALDEALRHFRPTLLKMDIESAELPALRGAANLIAAARPQLAICIYHRFDHYWLLPEFIESLQCGYRLYLRPHGFNGQETVLYALPG